MSSNIVGLCLCNVHDLTLSKESPCIYEMMLDTSEGARIYDAQLSEILTAKIDLMYQKSDKKNFW